MHATFIWAKDMAKVRIVVAMTLDGCLPAKEDGRLEWLKTDRRGFRRWYGSCDRRLSDDEPLVDFLCTKDRPGNRATYLAEIYDAGHLRLLRGLFLYHAVDEIVFYLLPVIRRGSVSIVGEFSAAEWKCIQIRRYGNGICRIVYRKLLQ